MQHPSVAGETEVQAAPGAGCISCKRSAAEIARAPWHPLPSTLFYPLNGACYKRDSTPRLPATYIPRNPISSAAWLLTFVGRVRHTGAPPALLKKSRVLHSSPLHPGQEATEQEYRAEGCSCRFPSLTLTSLFLADKAPEASGSGWEAPGFLGGFPVGPGFSRAGKSARIAFVLPLLYSCFPASLKQKRHGQYFWCRR